jgi:CPA2 family monovalent cation:H+ antiporter-2
LGVAATHEVAGALGMALVKAILAFIGVFLAGRYLLRRFFHLVTERRSAELFTLTVLFVSLVAAWVTKSLGLSMAFGAFLVGMMLSETEFRHQVESTIRPFRDVLLGLFFVSIGMLFDPMLLPQIWKEALLGAVALLGIKLVLVTVIVSLAGVDRQTALRTGMVLAVGGEFGFALLALGLEATLLPQLNAQIALTSVLLSMILAPFLIRYNQPLAAWVFARHQQVEVADPHNHEMEETRQVDHHVVICGFGRIGQTVSRFLEQEHQKYVATDLEPNRVRTARLAGQPVFYGDSADPAVLEALGITRAKLLIISHDDLTTALKTLQHARELNPDITIMVRTRDETHVDELRKAGANEVIPETLEAGMMLVSHALLALKLPLSRIARCIEAQRYSRYQMLRELFTSEAEILIHPDEEKSDRLLPVVLSSGSPALGKSISELALDQDKLVLTALVHEGRRVLSPLPATRLEEGDVLVLFGAPEDLRQARQSLSGVISD